MRHPRPRFVGDHPPILFRSLRPDFIETLASALPRRGPGRIVPVSKTGLHGDSVRPVSRIILLSDRLLGQRGGEISLGDHASGFLRVYRFLVDSEMGLRCSLFPATPLEPIIGFSGFASCPCSRCILTPSWPMPARVLVPGRRHDSRHLGHARASRPDA